MNWHVKPDPLEESVVVDCVDYAILRGWFCERIRETRRRGFPDHFFLRNGVVILVEFKRPKRDAESHQNLRHKQIREHGGTVLVIDSLEKMKEHFK